MVLIILDLAKNIEEKYTHVPFEVFVVQEQFTQQA